METETRLNILLVEDNPADVEIIRACFKSNGLADLTIVTDGEDALELLLAHARNANSLRPDLVLLDLGLPRLSGLEVLRAMKSDAQLRDIPVMVVTSSDAEADISEARRLQASKYLTKPRSHQGFSEIVTAVTEFWNMHFGVTVRDELASEI